MPRKLAAKENKKDDLRTISKRLTPRQQLFLKAYTTPTSETFGNAYRSAQIAGYKEEYCQNITVELPTWLQENLEDVSDEALIAQARVNISATLKDPKEKVLRHDATKFTLGRLDRRFSEKVETDVTSAGLPIQESVSKALLKVYGLDETQHVQDNVNSLNGSIEP